MVANVRRAELGGFVSPPPESVNFQDERPSSVTLARAAPGAPQQETAAPAQSLSLESRPADVGPSQPQPVLTSAASQPTGGDDGPEEYASPGVGRQLADAFSEAIRSMMRAEGQAFGAKYGNAANEGARKVENALDAIRDARDDLLLKAAEAARPLLGDGPVAVANAIRARGEALDASSDRIGRRADESAGGLLRRFAPWGERHHLLTAFGDGFFDGLGRALAKGAIEVSAAGPGEPVSGRVSLPDNIRGTLPPDFAIRIESDPRDFSDARVEDGQLVFGQDERRQVVPLDALGPLLGHQGEKVVLGLGEQKAVGIYSRWDQFFGKEAARDRSEREAATLSRLRERGIPAARAEAGFDVLGVPAILYDHRYAAGLKQALALDQGRPTAATRFDLVNERTLADLVEIRRKLSTEKIHVDDIEFLIDWDGSLVVSDPGYLIERTTPPWGTLSNIDQYIRGVQAVLAAR